ncbi:MAG: hypothetical protein K2W82_17525 [Candidatus Obscuribacterales bacterium]|nr:hypothetical protein [Candidatus Obscuribacterales bacterium]
MRSTVGTVSSAGFSTAVLVGLNVVSGLAPLSIGLVFNAALVSGMIAFAATQTNEKLVKRHISNTVPYALTTAVVWALATLGLNLIFGTRDVDLAGAACAAFVGLLSGAVGSVIANVVHKLKQK